jgi:hypothetical protein
MGHMTQADWDEYIESINEFHDDAFQQIINWKRIVTNLSENGEDDVIRTENIELKGLFLYNYFRSWPNSKPDTTGETDQESCMLILNNQYLTDLGYVNGDNQFTFKPVEDRFVLNGLTYKASGESHAAQAGSKPIIHFIILKREELNSSENKY